MDNIIENNKLIAEFLEWEFDDLSETFETPFLKLVEPQAFGDEQFSCKLQDFELEFHSDWNWLMSVVEKIENLQDENNCAIYNMQIEQSFTEIIDNHTSETIIYDIDADSKIEAVYNTVIEFIKWYNNKPLDTPDEANNNSIKRDRVLKSIIERYGGLCNLKSAMREDEDVVFVNLCDDLNDEISEIEVANVIMDLFK